MQYNEKTNKNSELAAADSMLNISVSLKAKFMPEQSEVQNNSYVWMYEVTIKNDSDVIVQLLNRYWRITNMNGRMDEIRGIGVVGLQPVIKPGKEFTYTSFCQLPTPQGTMEGHFEMQDMNDTLYEIAIPKLVLSAPTKLTRPFRSRLH